MGERRLEAGTYLSDGYGRRLAIIGRPGGWSTMESIARIWQPSRLKGILVSPDRGVPFLSAGQVFEAHPRPRKFLALNKTDDANNRYVDAGTILMSCSGNVGQVTIAHRPHRDTLITHDLLRIVPVDARDNGWLYAYMRTPMFRSIVVGTQYGHVIKHVEPAHLAAMPVVDVPMGTASRFQELVQKVFLYRDEAHALESAAFGAYHSALDLGAKSRPDMDIPFTVRTLEISGGRRRLDAQFNNPLVSLIAAAVQRGKSETVGSLSERIFMPNRGRRAFGPEGTPYRSAEELFDLNAPITKRVYAGLVENASEYMLEPGWIVMARSGQVYGLNGAVMLTTDLHRGVFATDDLIRIVVDESKVRAGYLLATLGHPELGRPMVIRHAYGTSIPHLEPGDVETIVIPRLDGKVEEAIADQLEAVARLRADADQLENDLTVEASSIVESFLRDGSPAAE